MSQQTVRIFISSPGDVFEEREKSREVIAELQRQYVDLTLETVLWEDLSLPATASFQQTIDIVLVEKPIDVAVFILWSRLGSPLADNITRSDGSPYKSGTEREFDIMLEAFKQSDNRQPVILAYTRKDDEGFVDRFKNENPDRFRELVDQRDLAKEFVQENFHDSNGRNIRAYHSYPEPTSFAQRLRVHLRNVLNEICLLYTSPSPRDRTRSRMPSSA